MHRYPSWFVYIVFKILVTATDAAAATLRRHALDPQITARTTHTTMTEGHAVAFPTRHCGYRMSRTVSP